MQASIVSELWPVSRNSRTAQIVLALAGTCLLAISAKVQVPFWPVPMTMQTFVVLVLAIAYGPKLGFFTGALYLLEGALGLHVFATGVGVAYLLGPTGGYLFGFVIAMSVVGFLVSKGWGQTALSVMGVMLIGEFIIFSLGVGWLSGVVGFPKAITLGFTPFLLAEAFKVVLAVVTVPLVWRALKR